MHVISLGDELRFSGCHWRELLTGLPSERRGGCYSGKMVLLAADILSR